MSSLPSHPHPPRQEPPTSDSPPPMRFPNEILLEIFKVTPQGALARACGVSRLWQALITPLLYRQPDVHGEVWWIRLIDTSVANKQLGALVKEVLSLAGCFDIGEEGVMRVATSLPNLKTLNLAFVTGVTVRSCEHIGRTCQTLQRLDLSGTEVSYPTLQSIVTSLEKLIDITDMTGGIDSREQFEWIAEKNPTLVLIDESLTDSESDSGTDSEEGVDSDGVSKADSEDLWDDYHDD
ncbi:hypothetical protein BDK51DRAFT_31922 [Blyttiomyces helicus]|uniref:F-box domain-containing protein n=1 Tax=Blyttiomyces helicus TaxID=388810 RepID=A0A4P9W4E2_9FUNG|nr:hypothetical protein BDK51DRAFT_31922 [Blyttiomyces helicus]|eukprot:RKO86115.1 hypothetical protein BDK51DRAFT_31922 [Blyttiomyces helicus]